MKLSEIFEKRVEFKTSEKPIHGLLNNSNLSHLGTGVTAIAYGHRKHPNTVIKTVQLVDKNDVFLSFVRICMNHKDNPFLPNIYAAKLYNVKQLSKEEREFLYSKIDTMDTPPMVGTYIMVLVMEKLFPIHSKENRIAATKILQQLNIIPVRPDEIPINLHGVRDPLSITNKLFAVQTTRQQLKNTSTNRDFKNALRLLEPIFNYGEPDLHKKNIMLRKTANGPELVLVDPVIG